MQYYKDKMAKHLIRVCQEWFPNEQYPERSGFLMHDILKQQIDLLIKNVIKDWDFTIIVTGGGEVRVGKSVLALQIAAYWTYQIEKVHNIKVPFNVKENIVFQWNKLIEQGNKLGQISKYCVLQYDEAGETMEGSKTQSAELKAVRDYLRECGQYNFLNILVMPEFFDLPKGIAITRSIFLIDVSYTANDEGIFQRGYFKFYSRRNKKLLYMKGKKELNYNAHPYNFDGEFRNFYPIDEAEYRKSKQEALKDRENGKGDKVMLSRDALMYHLVEIEGQKPKDVRDLIFQYTNLYLSKETIYKSKDKIKAILKRLRK